MTRSVYYLLMAIGIFIADQLSKWWVSEHLIRPILDHENLGPLGLGPWLASAPDHLPYTELAVLPFFNIVMVWNKGISFGLFNHDTDYGRWILIALAAVICVWFIIWLFYTQNRMQSLGIALVIGGALGNMADRLRFGAVIDFLDFHAFGYHWPAFNIADSCIVVGVFTLIVYSLFFEKNFHH